MKIKLSDSVPVNIYELRDPRDVTKSPRYIGITIKDIDKRLLGHLSSLKSKTHKNHWIKSLLKEGICPTIHLIEEVIGWDYACKVEQYWIKEFKEQGYILTNSTNGGEGSLGIIIREDTREKLKEASKGKNNPMYGKSGELSPAWGRHHDKETKKKIKESNRLVNSAKETPESSGLSYDKKRDRWIAVIHIDGVKISLGTYGDKENAIAIRAEVLPIKFGDTQPCRHLIKEVIDKHTKIEWCRKLLIKSPAVHFCNHVGKWQARMGIGFDRYNIGLFTCKEDAILAWKKEANKIVKEIETSYNINITN